MIFVLMSSRGKPSYPAAGTEDVESKALIVFFGAAEAPYKGTQLDISIDELK